MSQCSVILKYLESGKSITPAEAYELCGTLALHSRIAELRKHHVIDCELIETPTGKHVGRYSLQKIPYG
jgi:helix-turn-helix protein